jgi:hypothetical protein
VGNKTFHFARVTQDARLSPYETRDLLTAEDYGNGFVVTRTYPGQGQEKTKFDRYGGMWDGQQWVPEQGQKMVGRTDLNKNDFKPVNGEWKMIDKKLRWVMMTIGSYGYDQRIEVYEGYGDNGNGAGALLSRETITNGVKVHGEWQGGKWVVTTTGSKDFVKQTAVSGGIGGTLLSRNTLYNNGWEAVEVWGDKGAYTKNAWKGPAVCTKSDEPHYKVEIANNKMTITGYHLNGYRVYSGTDERDTQDGGGTVTWIYQLKTDGTIDTGAGHQGLIYYRAEQPFADGTYSATWEGYHYKGFFGGTFEKWAEARPDWAIANPEWNSRTGAYMDPKGLVPGIIPAPDDLALAVRR